MLPLQVGRAVDPLRPHLVGSYYNREVLSCFVANHVPIRLASPNYVGYMPRLLLTSEVELCAATLERKLNFNFASD